jgi:hypothetical protein
VGGERSASTRIRVDPKKKKNPDQSGYPDFTVLIRFDKKYPV